jgi:hypothetical protein
MEAVGVYVDPKELGVISAKTQEEIARLEAQIHALAGFAFNIGSPAQLAEVLFDRLNLLMLRWLLVEAGQSAAQHDPELRRKYRRLQCRRGTQVAKVALARRLAVRLYWLLREASREASSAEPQAVGSHAR